MKRSNGRAATGGPVPERQGGSSTEYGGQDGTRKTIQQTGNGKGTRATLNAKAPIAKALNEAAIRRWSFMSLRVSFDGAHSNAWTGRAQARGIGDAGEMAKSARRSTYRYCRASGLHRALRTVLSDSQRVSSGPSSLLPSVDFGLLVSPGGGTSASASFAANRSLRALQARKLLTLCPGENSPARGPCSPRLCHD